MMILDSRVAGIPCKISVTSFFVQRPMGRSADSDMDCYGYTEIEFDVLDTRGRPAPWLERKLNSDDKNAIEQEIIEAKENDRDYMDGLRDDYEMNAFRGI